MYIKNLVEMDLFPEPFPIRISNSKDKMFQYPAHWHKAMEIAVAAKKDFDIVINNRNYTLKEGDIVFISGGDIHSYPLSPGSERIIILFDLHDINTNALFKEDYPHISKSFFIKRTLDKNLHSHAMRHINEIINEATNVEPGFRLTILARIYDLLAMVVKNTNGTEKLASTYRKDLIYKVGRVLEYMDKNYMEKITLKKAAEEIGFSEHYLSRLFSRIVGNTFHQYLNMIRIKHAEESIILNEENISKIAFSCGFNSISTFNRIFRNMKGCTPLQYRKMQWNHKTIGKDDMLDEM